MLLFGPEPDLSLISIQPRCRLEPTLRWWVFYFNLIRTELKGYDRYPYRTRSTSKGIQGPAH